MACRQAIIFFKKWKFDHHFGNLGVHPVFYLSLLTEGLPRCLATSTLQKCFQASLSFTRQSQGLAHWLLISLRLMPKIQNLVKMPKA